ncbi:hypothetical protein SH661x_000908 [Planctomicrobium sp. SH661]|uniref:hypothetical protein n=1 Tax=Planctomicrobium sp. SH661 TaxID=3448124 RepID=UPI003F5B9757
MSIAQSERLKRELTDKYVVVQEGVPELRRFSGLTGQVKTVNMNGRALVQFDGPVDISWYDIDPAFLKTVAAPQPKAPKHEKPAAEAKPAPAKATAAPKADAGAAKKLSPLELARQQGAGGGAAPANKLSPLELARQQGAAGAAAAAPAPVAEAPKAPAPAAEPEPVSTPAPAASKKPALSRPGSTAEILALARQQGSMKK